MEETKQNNKAKKLLYLISGLGGISLIILIHEAGHFLFAKLFNVPTPLFSIGFGPALYSYSIRQTIFKVCLIPFGGYVEMDQEVFVQLTYLPKLLIIMAGIFFNLIFAYAILFFYSTRNKSTLKKTLMDVIKPSSSTKQTTLESNNNNVIGPIGIINMIGKSLAINSQYFWLMLAIISLNIGLFNILPLPFFDGGKALILTIETVIGMIIPPTALWFISTILFVLFMLCIMQITVNDIKQLFKK